MVIDREHSSTPQALRLNRLLPSVEASLPKFSLKASTLQYEDVTIFQVLWGWSFPTFALAPSFVANN